MFLKLDCVQKELLDPAVKGTLNVLRAAKECGVGRVVLVSSQAAMIPNPDWPVDVAVNEDSWADVDLLKKLQVCIKTGDGNNLRGSGVSKNCDDNNIASCFDTE